MPDGVALLLGTCTWCLLLEYRALKGCLKNYFGLSKMPFSGYFGNLLRAFEGLLEGLLGYIKAKVLVMLASSGA